MTIVASYFGMTKLRRAVSLRRRAMASGEMSRAVTRKPLRASGNAAGGGHCGTHISAGRRKNLHFVLEAASQSIPFYFEVVMRLQVEPELRGRSKKSREPKRSVGGDGPGAVHNFIDSPWRHANAVRQPILREPEWLDEIREQYFTRMNGIHLFRRHEDSW
jgi:hypothetical protein